MRDGFGLDEVVDRLSGDGPEVEDRSGDGTKPGSPRGCCGESGPGEAAKVMAGILG
jgi:hypothetical protein